MITITHTESSRIWQRHIPGHPVQYFARAAVWMSVSRRYARGTVDRHRPAIERILTRLEEQARHE